MTPSTHLHSADCRPRPKPSVKSAGHQPCTGTTKCAHGKSQHPLDTFQAQALPDWVAEKIDFNKTYTTDEQRMALTIKLLQNNVEMGTGGPFAAAIFHAETGRLTGVGVNRVMPNHDSTAHGEVVAIRVAEDAIDSSNLKGGYELFTSCEPCMMCFGATHWSGVDRMVTAATKRDAEALGFDEGPVTQGAYEYMEANGTKVVRNFMRDEAWKAMKQYGDSGGVIYNGK